MRKQRRLWAGDVVQQEGLGGSSFLAGAGVPPQLPAPMLWWAGGFPMARAAQLPPGLLQPGVSLHISGIYSYFGAFYTVKQSTFK